MPNFLDFVQTSTKWGLFCCFILARQKANMDYLRLSRGRINFTISCKYLLLSGCYSTGLALTYTQKNHGFATRLGILCAKSSHCSSHQERLRNITGFSWDIFTRAEYKPSFFSWRTYLCYCETIRFNAPPTIITWFAFDLRGWQESDL